MSETVKRYRINGKVLWCDCQPQQVDVVCASDYDAMKARAEKAEAVADAADRHALLAIKRADAADARVEALAATVKAVANMAEDWTQRAKPTTQYAEGVNDGFARAARDLYPLVAKHALATPAPTPHDDLCIGGTKGPCNCAASRVLHEKTCASRATDA